MKTSLGTILCVAVASMALADEKDAKPQATLLAQADPAVQEGRYDRDRDTRSVTESGRPTSLNKVSKLIGINVKNHAGDEIGEIEDVVVNLQKGSVAYVVMSTGGVLGIGEKLLAVPLTAFSRSADDSHLVLQADKDSISKAEGIKDDNWPSLDNPSFGAMPFWQEPRRTDVPRTSRPLTDPDR